MDLWPSPYLPNPHLASPKDLRWSRPLLRKIAARMKGCGLHSLHKICFVEFDKSRIWPEDIPSPIREQIDSMVASPSYQEMLGVGVETAPWDFRSSALLELTNAPHYVYKCYECENTDLTIKGGKGAFPRKYRWLQRLNYDGVYSWDEFGRATTGGADLCTHCA